MGTQSPLQKTRSFSPLITCQKQKVSNLSCEYSSPTYQNRSSELWRMEICNRQTDDFHQGERLLVCLGILDNFLVIEWSLEKSTQPSAAKQNPRGYQSADEHTHWRSRRYLPKSHIRHPIVSIFQATVALPVSVATPQMVLQYPESGIQCQ